MNNVGGDTRKTPEQLVDLMVESLEFLRVSCEAYDTGAEFEAKRLAVTLRVLCHDYAESSRSLFGQLGIKHKIAFFDTAPPINPDNIVSSLGLVVTYNTNPNLSGPYYAPQGELPPGFANHRAGFDDWWNRAVTKEVNGHEWCRAGFIKELANKEGGAHVDPRVSNRYQRLINDNGLGITFRTEQGAELGRPNNFLLASVRQIAYEVLRTANSPAYVYRASNQAG